MNRTLFLSSKKQQQNDFIADIECSDEIEYLLRQGDYIQISFEEIQNILDSQNYSVQNIILLRQNFDLFLSNNNEDITNTMYNYLYTILADFSDRANAFDQDVEIFINCNRDLVFQTTWLLIRVSSNLSNFDNFFDRVQDFLRIVPVIYQSDSEVVYHVLNILYNTIQISSNKEIMKLQKTRAQQFVKVFQIKNIMTFYSSESESDLQYKLLDILLKISQKLITLKTIKDLKSNIFHIIQSPCTSQNILKEKLIAMTNLYLYSHLSIQEDIQLQIVLNTFILQISSNLQKYVKANQQVIRLLLTLEQKNNDFADCFAETLQQYFSALIQSTFQEFQIGQFVELLKLLYTKVKINGELIVAFLQQQRVQAESVFLKALQLFQLYVEDDLIPLNLELCCFIIEKMVVFQCIDIDLINIFINFDSRLEQKCTEMGI